MTVDASLRTEATSVSFVDPHRISVTSEVAGAWDPKHVKLRLADRTQGEYGDLIIEISKPPLDGAEAERPGQVWCWICQDWFPKGEHK